MAFVLSFLIKNINAFAYISNFKLLLLLFTVQADFVIENSAIVNLRYMKSINLQLSFCVTCT